MKFSRYNILSRIRDSENWFIVNLLSGNADILSQEEASALELFRSEQIVPGEEVRKELAEKGYIADSETEQREYRRRYLDFLDTRENDEIQIFFVTNYSCNFACSYCYQDQYVTPSGQLTEGLIDAFLSHIRKEFNGRRKYITVFGGEPLLPGKRHRDLIAYLVTRSVEEGLDLCFVTNGYELGNYIGILKAGNIREVQVTLDGTAEIHNRRRFMKGGGETFEKITGGIDKCIDEGINVNLRMVVDRENIESLPDLAQFAIDRGWTASKYFKTQVGRNYELHHCQSGQDKLFDRISIYSELYELVKKYPHITEFYRPAYSVSRFLSENGELPDPLFDSCPACKTEWAYDYTGKIYPCTATVGKSDEVIGTFFPEVSRLEDPVRAWEERDVTTIPECRECPVQLACGGGCGSVAKNQTGRICSPDCRPVRELMELGFSAYFQSI